MSRSISYAQAIREATLLEMGRDESVVVLGLGVNDRSGIYGTTTGLRELFGEDRVFDTPISEDGMTGVAIGCALAGLRPVHVHIRMDFTLLAANQLINMAAKMRYMYGGAVSVPLVVRAVVGRSWGQGPQHSQSLYPMFMNIPGIRVVAPATAYDAKGALAACIRANDPVMFVEHRMLHNLQGIVPESDYVLPIGKARVLAEGQDVTLVGISYMAVECMRARYHLQHIGVSAEVIDPVWLSPLDFDCIRRSVEKTGAIVVADNAWTMCGAGAEIIARLAETTAGARAFKVRRLGFAPVPCPTTRNLESAFYPDARTVAKAARDLLAGRDTGWSPAGETPSEIAEFKGPF